MILLTLPTLTIAGVCVPVGIILVIIAIYFWSKGKKNDDLDESESFYHK